MTGFPGASYAPPLTPSYSYGAPQPAAAASGASPYASAAATAAGATAGPSYAPPVTYSGSTTPPLPPSYGGTTTPPMPYAPGAMAAPGMGPYVGPQGMDAAQITEQKGKAEAYLQNQCKAAIDMATQQRDHQRQLIQAETDRAIQLLTSQLTTNRDQALMQLEQSFLQHKMGLDQEQSLKRSEIEQAALFMTAQAQHSQA